MTAAPWLENVAAEEPEVADGALPGEATPVDGVGGGADAAAGTGAGVAAAVAAGASLAVSGEAAGCADRAEGAETVEVVAPVEGIDNTATASCSATAAFGAAPLSLAGVVDKPAGAPAAVVAAVLGEAGPAAAGLTASLDAVAMGVALLGFAGPAVAALAVGVLAVAILGAAVPGVAVPGVAVPGAAVVDVAVLGPALASAMGAARLEPVELEPVELEAAGSADPGAVVGGVEGAGVAPPAVALVCPSPFAGSPIPAAPAAVERAAAARIGAGACWAAVAATGAGEPAVLADVGGDGAGSVATAARLAAAAIAFAEAASGTGLPLEGEALVAPPAPPELDVAELALGAGVLLWTGAGGFGPAICAVNDWANPPESELDDAFVAPLALSFVLVGPAPAASFPVAAPAALAGEPPGDAVGAGRLTVLDAASVMLTRVDPCGLEASAVAHAGSPRIKQRSRQASESL